MANVGQATLTVQGGPNSGMTIRLTGTPITLGRRPDNDVVVDETSVSRRHALIFETPAGFALRDLSTTNGTYVNLDRVGHEERLLKHGDRIRLAGSQVTFVYRQEGQQTIKISIEPPPSWAGMVGEREPAGPVGPVRQEQREVSSARKEKDLLRLLESKKGAVVSREEIMRQVWPELVGDRLGNQVLDQAVERIRAQVEDDPRTPKRLISVGEFGFIML